MAKIINEKLSKKITENRRIPLLVFKKKKKTTVCYYTHGMYESKVDGVSSIEREYQTGGRGRAMGCARLLGGRRQSQLSPGRV